MTLVFGTTVAPAEVVRIRYQDPYPYFAWLRKHAPVVQEARPNGLSVWHVSRYSDVRALLADERLSKGFDEVPSLEAAVVAHSAGALGMHRCLLHADVLGRTRLGRLMKHISAARHVADIEPLVRMRADELIKTLPSAGAVDVIAAFAFPLTFTCICLVLGVPKSMRTDRFRQLVSAALSPGQLNGSRSVGDLRAHLAAVVQHKRSQDEPGDLLGALAFARDEGDRFSNEELISVAYLLSIVVHRLVLKTIGNGVLALLCHPGQLGRLRYAPELLPSAVDELLRYDSPVHHATFRLSAKYIKIRGLVIPRGHVISMMVASANRDSDHFAAADELDVTRRPNDQLSLGLGPHDCLCTALARRCLEIAVGQLVGSLDMRLVVDDGALRWWRPDVARGLVTLPILYRKW